MPQLLDLLPKSELSVFKRALQTLALQNRIAPLLPNQGQGMQVVRWDGTALVIFASSGSLATRLRNQAPSIIERLKQAGIPVSDLKVKVAVNVPPNKPAKRAVMSDEALASLERCSEQVHDTRLKASLDALIRRQRKLIRFD
ncbi:DciA family protein [Chitinivorax sp. PXF-14]|uniref:DciA family protein n=1 Tax=Chitinivorax sp. PXF-14 TaxID=3230488 RepID=UPI0034655918